MNQVMDGGLPQGPLISWYGDDFTGASAVMEVLTSAGLHSVLFLDLPSPDLLARFSKYRGIGLAGVARSKSPQWMDANLPAIFRALSSLNTPIVHYKICSTLDSAPHIGSIGKAIDLAQAQFSHCAWIPFVAAAPAIKRYQFLANLFVVNNDVGHRLDRHPAASLHPVTPMAEADVRLHLSKQTDIQIGLIDYLAAHKKQALDRELSSGKRIIALDVVDDDGLISVGELIWERRGERLFVVGSQGVEYALTAYWLARGFLPEPVTPRVAPAERIAVVSGSCSPTTSEQIAWAGSHGFALIPIDTSKAVDDRAWQTELGRATSEALNAIGNGRDPLVYSARGPEDPAIGSLLNTVKSLGVSFEQVNESIGKGLGSVLDSILRRTKVRLGVLAGGDTSGYGAGMLGVYALTLAAITVPGAALFRAHCEEPSFSTLELAFKGGQMGSADYFGQIKAGGAGSV